MLPVLLLTGVNQVGSARELPATELAPITVSAHAGHAIPYDRSGVSVAVLEPAGLRAEGISNLGEALTRVPGVYTSPGGGSAQMGNATGLAIRGMSSAQFTLPMMDGLRLYDNSAGCNLTPNILARTNMFDLGRLEILKGSQGAVYGNGAVGGVIYMETPEGEGPPSCSIFNEYGSFSTYTGNLTTQGRQDTLSYFISATVENSDNDLRTVNGGKAAAPEAGQYRNWQEALRLDYRPDPTTHARITYRRGDARYHTPGTWGDPHYAFRTNLVSVAMEKKLTHAFSSELSGGYYGADYMFGHGTNHDLRNMQANWRNEYRWCRHQSTTAGLAFMHSEHHRNQAGHTDAGSRHEENTASLFAEHSITPVPAWVNTLACRWDESDVFGSLFTFRAAVSYSFNDGKTRIFTSLGRGYKAPSSFQRMRGEYTDAYGSTYKGNPQLDCQTSRSTDLGLEHEWLPGHSVSVTLFRIRTQDAITTVWQQDHYEFLNSRGHSTSQGVELGLEGTWEDYRDTGYSLSLTLCKPTNPDGRQIGYTARQVWAADLHTSPQPGFTTGIGLAAAAGRSNYEGAPIAHFDAYYTLRWYARYEINRHITLHLRVENLTDQKYVSEDVYGDFGQSFINPGTSVHAGCTLTF